MLRDELRRLSVGECVTVAAHRVGGHRREGEIVEVMTESGRERCRVRWDEGGESVLYPSPDLTIERPAKAARRAGASP